MRKMISLEEHATKLEAGIIELSLSEAQSVLIMFLRGKYGTRNRSRLNQFAEIMRKVKTGDPF